MHLFVHQKYAIVDLLLFLCVVVLFHGCFLDQMSEFFFHVFTCLIFVASDRGVNVLWNFVISCTVPGIFLFFEELPAAFFFYIQANVLFQSTY